MRLPIIVGFSDYELSSTTKNFLQNIEPLGVILFSKNIASKEQLLKLISSLRAFDAGLLISIDFEGGAIHRFSEDIPVPASAKAISRTINWEKVQQNIEFMAQTLSFFDIDINFAPVVDIVREDTNQVLENRGFFPDPQLITYYNKIFWQIHQKYGVHTSVKHFAGLAKITQDPHSKESIFNGTPADFELGLNCYSSLPENPFSQSVMTSHVIYPQLDDIPVTFSSKILSKYLREKMNFEGIVFTDCLEMKASSSLYPPEQIAIKVLQTGHDILLSSGQIKDSSFSQKLAVGMRAYFQKEPQKAKQLEEKILYWKSELQKHKTKINYLPDYKEVMKLNKSFIEKIKRKTIKKITNFHIIAPDNKFDILTKFHQKFPSLSSSKPLEPLLDFKKKTLVIVIDNYCQKEYRDFFVEKIATAYQVLVIAVSTKSNFLYNEEWILWGKNHLILDCLLELFLEKITA